MGREIRRVPPDWQHPMYMHQYLGRPMKLTPHPLFDEVYEDALVEIADVIERELAEALGAAVQT